MRWPRFGIYAVWNQANVALLFALALGTAASGPPPLPCSTPGGAVGPAVVEALQQLHALHATGALDDAEFARAKRAVLGM